MASSASGPRWEIGTEVSKGIDNMNSLILKSFAPQHFSCCQLIDRLFSRVEYEITRRVILCGICHQIFHAFCDNDNVLLC